VILSDEEKKYLLTTARERIRSQLEKRQPFYENPTENLKNYYGAFVTLHHKGALRGCIGQMTGAMPLFELIREMAYSSAFSDPRFPPLSVPELPDIDIEISVLSPMEEIQDPSVVEVGVHGLYMQQGPYSGVLLPQVPEEQGWDRETFLTNTCYKAGLRGDCWKKPGTKILVFTAEVFGEKDLSP